MRTLPVVPPTRVGVVTFAEAAAEGWTRSALAAAVKRGDLEHPRRGCWAPALDPSDPGSAAITLARRAVCASLATAGAGVSHLSAATCWRVPTWAPDAQACVTERGRRRAASDGVHRHRATGEDFDEHGGVLLTNPARTMFDVAREYGPQSGLVVADAALRAGLVTADDIATAAKACRGWPGARTARLIAALADPRSESPWESRSRWQFRRFDVPPPEPQMNLYTLDGRFVARVDFWWDEGVVGEVDGDAKYDQHGALVKEKWRQDEIERLRARVVRWGSQGLDAFGPVAEEIALKRRLARADPDPPRWIARPSPVLYVPPDLVMDVHAPEDFRACRNLTRRRAW